MGAGEHAQGSDDGVTRWQHEGRVHRWQRPGSAWPGHTTFVAIRAGEVVVGDRYARDGVERSYACEPRELLEGCFAAQVAEQLGEGVLQELLAEVRRMLGMEASASVAGRVEASPPAARERPSEPAPVVVSAQAEAGREPGLLDVTVVSCPLVSLPLAVELRSLTRAPIAELLERLRELPCRVLAGVSPAQAERARVLLLTRGASVELSPAT